jgi:hypothetical protein
MEPASDVPRDHVPVEADHTGPTPPSTKQLVGLLLGGLGGMLLCIGALMPWVRTTFVGIPDEISPTYVGIDLPDGKVVFALGVAVLAGLIASRFVASATHARWAAIVAIVAGFAAVGVVVVMVFTSSRFQDSAVESVLAQFESPTAEMASQVEELIGLDFSAGPFVAIGGGVLALVGGALVLAAANPRRREEQQTD